MALLSATFARQEQGLAGQQAPRSRCLSLRTSPTPGVILAGHRRPSPMDRVAMPPKPRGFRQMALRTAPHCRARSVSTLHTLPAARCFSMSLPTCMKSTTSRLHTQMLCVSCWLVCNSTTTRTVGASTATPSTNNSVQVARQPTSVTHALSRRPSGFHGVAILYQRSATQTFVRQQARARPLGLLLLRLRANHVGAMAKLETAVSHYCQATQGNVWRRDGAQARSTLVPRDKCT